MTTRTPFSLYALDGSRIDHVSLEIVKHATARRCILRVPDPNCVRVTIPRRGTVYSALAFARTHETWIAEQITRLRKEADQGQWSNGAQIMYRGDYWSLEVDTGMDTSSLRLGDQTLVFRSATSDLRSALEATLMAIACEELPQRTQELSRLHRIPIRSITVRNQRTRWGSCSRHRDISLNWRLIQIPAFVSDYIIVHELMHCLEMNHSRRFWHLVESAYPDTAQAKAWLRGRSLLAFQNAKQPQALGAE